MAREPLPSLEQLAQAQAKINAALEDEDVTDAERAELHAASHKLELVRRQVQSAEVAASEAVNYARTHAKIEPATADETGSGEQGGQE